MPVLQPERIKSPEAVERNSSLGARCDRGHGLWPDSAASVAGYSTDRLFEFARVVAAAPSRSRTDSGGDRAGDRKTGITVIYMDEGLDTGDILLAIAVRNLAWTKPVDRLHDRLAQVAPRL